MPVTVVERLRRVAQYQFGRGAEVLVPGDGEVTRRRSGKPEDVVLDGERLATFRVHVGLFSLSVEGAARLHGALEEPRCRVFVNEEAAPFVAEGSTAFATHVVEVDEEVRAGDEVLVVDCDDKLLGTGTASLCGSEMLSFERGEAVSMREGVR